jgi:hypothetical protein
MEAMIAVLGKPSPLKARLRAGVNGGGLFQGGLGGGLGLWRID